MGAEFVFDFFPEEKKEFRNQVRTKVQRTFPEHAAAVAKSYGLTRYREQYARTATRDPAAPSVVPIHGLDEPGEVWMNLAPALMADGMQVLEMRYPNDQPIVESAWLFYQELRYLRQIGVLRRSQFLITLNERPHPEGVQMLVIAGIASPWNEDGVHRFVDLARDRSPAADFLSEALRSIP